MLVRSGVMPGAIDSDTDDVVMTNIKGVLTANEYAHVCCVEHVVVVSIPAATRRELPLPCVAYEAGRTGCVAGYCRFN